MFNDHQTSIEGIEQDAIFKKPLHFDMRLTDVKQKFKSLELQLEDLENKFNRKIDRAIQ